MQVDPTNKRENIQEALYVATLSSGEKVYNRPNGHIHETIKDDVPEALQHIQAEGRNEIIETVLLKNKQWKSFKVQVDPEHDELFLARRFSRKGLSTFVRNKEPGTTNTMVVILTKNDVSKGMLEGYTVITAYSGDRAPREPWDSYFTEGITKEEEVRRKQEKEEALLYWTHHAFIPDEKEFPIDKGTEQAYKKDALKFPFLTPEEKEKQVVYTGLFVVDKNEILDRFPPRHERVFAHHSTLEFMPKNSNDITIGRTHRLKILARVTDEQGDALLVESPQSKIAHPHITLSCADGVSPVYSNELLEKAIKDGSLEYLPEPVYIDVVEGFENGNRKVVTKDTRLV